MRATASRTAICLVIATASVGAMACGGNVESSSARDGEMQRFDEIVAATYHDTGRSLNVQLRRSSGEGVLHVILVSSVDLVSGLVATDCRDAPVRVTAFVCTDETCVHGPVIMTRSVSALLNRFEASGSRPHVRARALRGGALAATGGRHNDSWCRPNRWHRPACGVWRTLKPGGRTLHASRGRVRHGSRGRSTRPR